MQSQGEGGVDPRPCARPLLTCRRMRRYVDGDGGGGGGMNSMSTWPCRFSQANEHGSYYDGAWNSFPACC